MRRLTQGELRLARSVFGEAIDYRRVRLIRRSGRNAITFWSWITFPALPADFAAEDAAMQAWLVHELTHVWQFQTAPLRTLLSWAGVLLSGGYGPKLSGYRYGFPFAAWGAYNLEQQASMVEHAFLLRERGVCTRAPPQAGLADYEACVPFLTGSR